MIKATIEVKDMPEFRAVETLLFSLKVPKNTKCTIIFDGKKYLYEATKVNDKYFLANTEVY